MTPNWLCRFFQNDVFLAQVTRLDAWSQVFQSKIKLYEKSPLWDVQHTWGTALEVFGTAVRMGAEKIDWGEQTGPQDNP